jgi:hypothetical protein
MGFFNRSKKETSKEYLSQLPPPKKCEHKYQDFPWYISFAFSDDKYSIDIIEPYVCIFCGDRKNVTLAHFDGNGDNSYKRGSEILKNLNRDYEHHIRGRAEIEDMINDMQLVDPQYLQYYHMLQGTTDPSTSRQNNFEVKKDFNLKI